MLRTTVCHMCRCVFSYEVAMKVAPRKHCPACKLIHKRTLPSTQSYASSHGRKLKPLATVVLENPRSYEEIRRTGMTANERAYLKQQLSEKAKVKGRKTERVERRP